MRISGDSYNAVFTDSNRTCSFVSLIIYYLYFPSLGFIYTTQIIQCPVLFIIAIPKTLKLRSS